MTTILSSGLNYLEKHPGSEVGKTMAQFEMPGLKKRMWLSGALSVVATAVAFVALALIPAIGQVLCGVLLALGLVSASYSYFAFKTREAISVLAPNAELAKNTPAIVEKIAQSKIVSGIQII
jgi:hypothetical protein